MSMALLQEAEHPQKLRGQALARIQLTLDLGSVGAGSSHTHDVCMCVCVCVCVCVYPHGLENEGVTLAYHVQYPRFHSQSIN